MRPWLAWGLKLGLVGLVILAGFAVYLDAVVQEKFSGKRWTVPAKEMCIRDRIGFIGLVVPHLMRLLVGPDHRLLLPASALAGASLLLLADLVARLALAPAELPIGIVTALIGAPFFLYLLVRGRS